MSDVSNKTIIALLGVALLVTFVGTFFSVTETFDRISSNSLLTGAATDTASGTSTVTISSTTSLTSQVATLAFGSGYVNSSATECMMHTSGKHNLSASGSCIGFVNLSDGFLLENTGNVNMSINYTCAGSCTGDDFIGGTSPAFELQTFGVNFDGQTGETGAADSSNSCAGQGFNGPNGTLSPISAGGDWLCGNNTNYPLDFTDTQDAIVVHLNVSIPTDAATGGGEQTATFTFNALSPG
jgi:hypothetical protein